MAPERGKAAHCLSHGVALMMAEASRYRGEVVIAH